MNSVQSVRNEHWNDHPATPSDAASYADGKDDQTSRKHLLKKELAKAAIGRPQLTMTLQCCPNDLMVVMG